MTVSAKHKLNLSLAIPVIIILACFFITLTSKFKLHETLLSNAILIDLLITAPLLYFIAVRKVVAPKLTVTKVFLLGLLIAGWLLNSHSNTTLHFIKTFISPVIELFIIVSIGRKFYIATKKAKSTSIHTLDFLSYCRLVVSDAIGNEKIGNIISSEIAVLYYAFIGRKAKNIDYISTFSNHKENGVLITLGAFLFIFLLEGFGMHLILNMWNKTFAWIITGLSIYTCLQLYAHIKAVMARPIIIRNNTLEIHNGLAGDAFIEFDNIDKIELSNKIPTNRNAMKIALIGGLENHNVVVYLKQPIEATKVFGIKRQIDTVLFFVDKPKEFLEAVSLKI